MTLIWETDIDSAMSCSCARSNVSTPLAIRTRHSDRKFTPGASSHFASQWKSFDKALPELLLPSSTPTLASLSLALGETANRLCSLTSGRTLNI